MITVKLRATKTPTPLLMLTKKLEVSELDKALSNFTPEQLVELNKSGDLNIGKGVSRSLKIKSILIKMMIGDFKRIEEEDWGTSEADDKGLIYKTYKDKGGGILKIGNISGHRYEDSAYKDIKIIDYDATIANYDPQESLKSLGIVKNVVRGEKGKIKKVEFKKPKIKRADYDADTFRTARA